MEFTRWTNDEIEYLKGKMSVSAGEQYQFYMIIIKSTGQIEYLFCTFLTYYSMMD